MVAFSIVEAVGIKKNYYNPIWPTPQTPASGRGLVRHGGEIFEIQHFIEFFTEKW